MMRTKEQVQCELSQAQNNVKKLEKELCDLNKPQIKHGDYVRSDEGTIWIWLQNHEGKWIMLEKGHSIPSHHMYWHEGKNLGYFKSDCDKIIGNIFDNIC